ncbi:DNA integrity scanning protein DisA nucleotide-binding domain protein [Mesomycoplasma ovipneumoniae]|uniref:DNA integrity scanning protein DisA nucleotide-binding domain protein n=1 Tax=Mesomycoplasma ovipneumoniae TaxID=29562 RepID=A0AAJ2P914_9BACT|nr:DNA integrity scanning protein DisA nucleotide-binding domain protein [Mesomycoplasma ovipneumoniae]MCP9306861.1 DNA integrity scanning protein DisA nucleotide-binding domain protein [Mesomycoplasma ovipneumoniae]MDW2833953.1 DNA integrity scanning protein DisA nucleotide-binding domain protein [Mesomycoplasma ovipneumoniae]MDW2906150.1 DNA integrity scanning protein DisA nucleotide-binding domain protein [Mesomycoplasma ovipneumoniae]MDW2914174.1 DNA integrity scanning protein DisA nucleoti
MNLDIVVLIISALTLVLGLFFAVFFIYNHIKTLHKNKVNRSFVDLGISTQRKIVYELYFAVKYLSKNKVGAIITLQRNILLDSLRTDGVKIDSLINSSLLIAIFQKSSPLHDGAVIIVDDRILYASTYFSVSESTLEDRYGARHRAALGISEVSDSITVVVSEQSGEVVIVRDANFFKVTNLETFTEVLTKELNSSQTNTAKK